VISNHRNGLVVALAVCVTSAALVACSAGPDSGGEPGPKSPTSTGERIDPSNFVLPVDNPFFPLEPGTTYRYVGVKEGRRAVDVFTVTDDTKVILGVANTVLVDKLLVECRSEEIAHDWYTQDRKGNVWYLGETIEEFDQ
jgi:hypothetical protein